MPTSPRLRRLLLLLAGTVVLLILALPSIRRSAVTLLSDDYQPEPSAQPLQLAESDVMLTLQLRAEGFDQPTEIAFVPGQPERAVVLEKTGGLWWLDLATGQRGELARLPVKTPSEMGLLGVAFHPEFAGNGRFFLNSNPGNNTLVEEWRVPPGQDVAGATATKHGLILEVEQPYPNHNAGQLLFGPDGMLYVPLGDGGFKDDIHGHGQNRETLLGNILRLDVDSAEPYAVPPDNPFVGQEGVRPEIWAWGVRNPWRNHFDPQGRLVVADVGQNTWEEIAFASAGANLGWNRTEGNACFQPDCSFDGTRGALWTYGRTEGTSITGGAVYAGSVADLTGRYVFADFVSGRMWALPLPDDLDGRVEPKDVTSLGRWRIHASTFATAPDGELWVADFGEGKLYALANPW